ncbi:MAG: hypothetical protein K1X92_15710 [Bacteroidia bacterium]|nr:hypothetical protein [Bacteroidia bacterium]
MKSQFILTLFLLCLGFVPFTARAGCIFGDCENGRGSWEDDNGGLYSGEFKSGMKHGNGIYMDKEGSVYSGSWKYGVMHGSGTARLTSGVKITGVWKNGKISGKGKYIYPGGEVYTGRIYPESLPEKGLLAIEKGATIQNSKQKKNKEEEKKKIQSYLKNVISETEQNVYEISEDNIEFFSPPLETTNN